MIPTGPLANLARVYGFGAVKYADPWQWRGGIELSRRYDAVQRHLNAMLAGEWLDPESGLPHVSHAAWGCFAIEESQMFTPEQDDRVEQAQFSPMLGVRRPR